jgi:glucose/arabinose dehydrogenase
MFPPSYKNKIIIPEHGSWNRSKNAGHTGHKLSLVTEENGVGIHYKTFVEGFLNKSTNTAWGRPVDILVLEDGSILISDDKSGTIYRMSYLG